MGEDDTLTEPDVLGEVETLELTDKEDEEVNEFDDVEVGQWEAVTDTVSEREADTDEVVQ